MKMPVSDDLMGPAFNDSGDHITKVPVVLHTHVLCPEPALDEVAEQMSVHLNEITREHPAHTQILDARLERYIVPENLRNACYCGARCKHWCH